jgi:hypothetical protein
VCFITRWVLPASPWVKRMRKALVCDHPVKEAVGFPEA